MRKSTILTLVFRNKGPKSEKTQLLENMRKIYRDFRAKHEALVDEIYNQGLDYEWYEVYKFVETEDSYELKKQMSIELYKHKHHFSKGHFKLAMQANQKRQVLRMQQEQGYQFEYLQTQEQWVVKKSMESARQLINDILSQKLAVIMSKSFEAHIKQKYSGNLDNMQFEYLEPYILVPLFKPKGANSKFHLLEKYQMETFEHFNKANGEIKSLEEN